MQVIVLGSAAGGGVPQWNCRCRVCRLAWSGDERVVPRTQSSLAVSADGVDWLLINASPDLRQQVAATPALQPRDGTRHSPIKAVLLTNGDVDHVAGLLTLREGQPFALHGTPDILASLAANRVFDVLSVDLVPRRAVSPGSSFEPLPGLSVTLFAVPGKVPLWLEDGTPEIGRETDATVGVLLEANGRRYGYVPACARITDGLKRQLHGLDGLLFDGTVFEDDDLIRAEVGTKTGRRMGHVAMAGPEGSIASLSGLAIGERVFVHINNTNPALVADSPERLAVEAAGWILAADGHVMAGAGT